MDKIKKLVNIFVPVSACNFKCPYCYISHFENRRKDLMPNFEYSPAHVGKALSQRRLGGPCFMNVCGDGETLLPPEMPAYIGALLDQGHYLEVVTNGISTKRFETICQLPATSLARLEFKFSFHYTELVRTHTLDVFFSNVQRVKDAGCSFTIELTPCDEMVPLIPEIQQVCAQRLGTLCHVTIARNDATPGIDYLTDLPKQQYMDAWNSFDSEMFRFKNSVFGKKRTEYCYAGAWSLLVNLANGHTRQCYCSEYNQNIFKDLNKPIAFHAVGNRCSLPHCYNGHALLTLGLVPELETPTYTEIRNRTNIAGEEWLQPNIKAFFNTKLTDTNPLYTEKEKKANRRAVTLHKPIQFLARAKNWIGKK